MTPLQTALMHIEHMSAFIVDKQKRFSHGPSYSFEAIGEDIEMLRQAAENEGWFPISNLPAAPEFVIAYCQPCNQFPEGRMMVWKSTMLALARQPNQPGHLQFPATHFCHLPSPPRRSASEVEGK